MLIVCVTFKIADGRMAEFMPLMYHQAQNSLSLEADCHQFDVCTDPDRPDEVFLYERYSDREAFDLHLASDHFLAFDAEVAPMVSDKSVNLWKNWCDGR